MCDGNCGNCIINETCEELNFWRMEVDNTVEDLEGWDNASEEEIAAAQNGITRAPFFTDYEVLRKAKEEGLHD